MSTSANYVEIVHGNPTFLCTEKDDIRTGLPVGSPVAASLSWPPAGKISAGGYTTSAMELGALGGAGEGGGGGLAAADGHHYPVEELGAHLALVARGGVAFALKGEFPVL